MRQYGLKCEVYGADKLKELKMGAFWGVTKGSEEPPALIVMTYEPKNAPATPVLGLVGKGITFDTGGISIKPADGMEKMKYDMAGGAAMIGAMQAIAQLKPAVKVIGVVCAAENMPSGTAMKPGDVQIAMSGKSIEIINTDAEGRLVLADGLAYARQLGATHLIDAATLTGACVVALGMVNAGCFSNDEETYRHFTDALEISGERFWRLPVEDDYKEMIKSSIADIMNTGGSRWGGAITAAMFLKEFVEDTPWIHLDIAGVAWTEEQKPWMAKGPSGYCGAHHHRVGAQLRKVRSDTVKVSDLTERLGSCSCWLFFQSVFLGWLSVAELPDQPLVERRQIVRLAAGGEVLIRDHLFIHPVTACVANIGAHRRPGSEGSLSSRLRPRPASRDRGRWRRSACLS